MGKINLKELTRGVQTFASFALFVPFITARGTSYQIRTRLEV